MTDTPVTDLAPEPGDTFIELRDGVPWIGTVPDVKAVSLWRHGVDVTDVFTAAFDADELRDPHTGKWIRDPAGRFLDPAVKELGPKSVMISYKGHTIDPRKNGFLVKLKNGEKQHYEHAYDAAEAARRGKHLAPGELKHGVSHLPGKSAGKLTVGDRVTDGKREGTLVEIRPAAKTLGNRDSASVKWDGGKNRSTIWLDQLKAVERAQVKTGDTPDGRHWTVSIGKGGKGSTYEIDAKPGGDASQYRDQATKATYRGDGMVKIEHRNAAGDWVAQPGGDVSLESLKTRTKLYQQIAAELEAAQVAEDKARPKVKPSGHTYGPWSSSMADKVQTDLKAPLESGGGTGAGDFKAHVASQIAARMSDVSAVDMVAAAYPSGMSGYSADKGKYLDAAKNPGKYVYTKSSYGTLQVAPAAAPTFPDPKPVNEQVLREWAASQLIASWAGTSNDHNPLSLAIQEAAIQEFALKNTAPWTMPPDLAANVKEDVATHGPVYRKFLRAQYEETQADFKKRGIKSVNVLRGMRWSTASPPAWAKGHAAGTTIPVPPFRPLSSWTVDNTTASSFAGHSGKSLTLGATVPVESILSWPRTGFGCLSEYELVLLTAIDGQVTVRKTTGL